MHNPQPGSQPASTAASWPCWHLVRHFSALHDIICSCGASPIVCTPLGDKTSLLYGLQEQGEAYLLPTLLAWAQASESMHYDMMESCVHNPNQPSPGKKHCPGI